MSSFMPKGDDPFKRYIITAEKEGFLIASFSYESSKNQSMAIFSEEIAQFALNHLVEHHLEKLDISRREEKRLVDCVELIETTKEFEDSDECSQWQIITKKNQIIKLRIFPSSQIM